MAQDPLQTARPIRSANQRFLGIDLGITDFGGLHIDPIELSELVVDHGVGAELWRAQTCPCIRQETLGPRGNCPSCRGLRWIHPEGSREPVVVLMTSQAIQRAQLAGGEILTGTAQVTFPLGIHPAHGDMVLPDGEVHVVHETLWRANNPVDGRRVKSRITSTDEVPSRPKARRERILYPKVAALEAVWYWGGERAVEATEGHDFRYDGDGEVRWFDGRGPGQGEAFTVRYLAPAAYMLNPGEPAYRHEGDREFPYKAIAQRLDRWGDPDHRDGAP